MVAEEDQGAARRARGLGCAAAVAGRFELIEPAGDGAAERENDGGNQQEPGNQAHECRLRRTEQNQGSGGAAQQAGQAHGEGEAAVFADVVAIGVDRGDLAGPEGDGIGGVGLDRQHARAQHGGKEQERAAAGHGVQHPGQKGGNDEPDPVPVDGKGKTGEGEHWSFIVKGLLGGAGKKFAWPATQPKRRHPGGPGRSWGADGRLMMPRPCRREEACLALLLASYLI